MAKTATKKKNIKTSIRNRLVAAISMLLIASIMLVTSTYAWFTLSTAPEVKGIDTSVAGNGSLEVALMPTNGQLAAITSGRSGTNGGGTVELVAANTTWGNLITLSDAYYGIDQIELNPIKANVLTAEFQVPTFGYDGRIKALESAELKSFDLQANKFTGTDKGVRAIVMTEGTGTDAQTTAYGYVIDLAFRINTTKDDGTAASLKLQDQGIQRVYNGDDELESIAPATQGGGSYMKFDNISKIDDIKKGLRIAFIQNYGITPGQNETVTPTILAFAEIKDNNGGLRLYNLVETTENNVTTITKVDVQDNVLLSAMNKNTAYQISVVVWLDGENVTNADFAATAAEMVKEATLNLQFSTDAELIPALNTNLRDNPPAPVTPANNSGNENQQGGENQQSNTPAYTVPDEVTAAQLTALKNAAASAYTSATSAESPSAEQTALITAYDAADSNAEDAARKIAADNLAAAFYALDNNNADAINTAFGSNG